MRIAVIQASSQSAKNSMIYETVRKYACDSTVLNFGCRQDEEYSYSYVEISLLVGMLLYSKAVDFVVTGCSSGQGMMLACNSMPGVLCGYVPTPLDAYLFCQINNGNAVSLPLGEGYTWQGYDNFENTVKEIFSEPFGQGYPKSEAVRKRKDTELLKQIRKNSQIGFTELMDKTDRQMIGRILRKTDVIDYVRENGSNEIKEWLTRQQ